MSILIYLITAKGIVPFGMTTFGEICELAVRSKAIRAMSTGSDESIF